MLRFFIILIWASFSPVVNFPILGQTLLLPSPPQFARGEGICDDLAVAIYSEHWRVRKGDVFDLEAVLNNMHSDLSYRWTVSNGKIISGQGNLNVKVKAGGAKTRGFLNASGFVRVTLLVERGSNPGKCSVQAAATIMVGKHREMNGRPYVKDLLLDRAEISLPCSNGDREKRQNSNDLTIGISTIGEDPENDFLSYHYSVSGGKIIGIGAKAKWDLNGVEPGKYFINAGVDDGFGLLGQTQTRSVSINPCNKQ